jgi:hypothetical protein
MDQAKIKKSIENFKNNSRDEPYLILVASVTGDYFTAQEFADNCGPGTNRELVGIKQPDGSIYFIGELKDYDDTSDN